MAPIQLIIGNKNYSSWSLRPWLVLRHLGIDFEEVRLSLFTDSFTQQIQHYSGAGKVPILRVGDQSIWESLAICEYLAERHPELWPLDPMERARARSAVAEMHAGFTALRAELPMNCRARQRLLDYSAEAAADIRRMQLLWSECKGCSSREGPWLFGDFGIVDAFFAPVAIRFNAYQVPLEGFAVGYQRTQLDNPLLQEWIAAGRAESEVLEEEEVGLDP